jgi:RNA polymerase sigma-70 factor, ECF subfamily
MKPTINIRRNSGPFTVTRLFPARNYRITNKRSRVGQRATSNQTLHAKPSGVVDETIRRAQQGDAAAFETLYELHSRRVYSLCLRMIGDPVEAEDLTQEAFLQLFRKIHTFRGESAFTSWLHRLTANIVLMRFRKKVPPVTSLDEMLRDDDESNRPKFEIGMRDLRLAGVIDRLNLEGLLEELPEGYRSIFILHDVHGYEHNEIAAILGCSVGNSKSQLHKARKRLRELLPNEPANRSVAESRAAGNPNTSTINPASSATITRQHAPDPEFHNYLLVEAPAST